MQNMSSTSLFSTAKLSARHRRNKLPGVVCAIASPATPLTKTDLVDYLRKGCKPRDKWRIGTEHEKLGFNRKDQTRFNYDQIKVVFEKFQSRFGWEPIMEQGQPIGVKMDGQSVTLEPGGQFELSGAPLRSIHQTCAEVNQHLYQVKTVADELGVSFLGIGFDPKWRFEDVPMMPKNRYKIMKAYMPTRGSLGLDMMFRSCTIQVNLDFLDEQDMIEKMRIGVALQPIAVALFANSPFRDGKPNGYKSWRSHVWSDTDPDRCGNLPFVFEDNFGFERYVDYVLDVPMYFVYRNGTYLDATGLSFKDFMEGKLPILPGDYPTMEDWESHLTTVFPEVRLKKYIEMRGADGGPWGMICALPALWVGLLYDKNIQDQVYQYISDWTQEDRDHLYNEVPKTGLQTPFKGGTVQDVAKQILQFARIGLESRGNDEEGFLGNLEQIAESGESQADVLLKKYETVWNHSIDPIYTECSFQMDLR
eukprot:TRINITY_DN7034_c1_g3_i2.p2 TRINITY_DN7034_c1_g3~~TRINITY_DN7034_c1_g3_i2.p2  ORF type:complete len:477 (-),score=37.72 TRINITY_DN7034_c1_g3_i2:318-1748(-)